MLMSAIRLGNPRRLPSMETNTLRVNASRIAHVSRAGPGDGVGAQHDGGGDDCDFDDLASHDASLGRRRVSSMERGDAPQLELLPQLALLVAIVRRYRQIQ